MHPEFLALSVNANKEKNNLSGNQYDRSKFASYDIWSWIRQKEYCRGYKDIKKTKKYYNYKRAQIHSVRIWTHLRIYLQLLKVLKTSSELSKSLCFISYFELKKKHSFSLWLWYSLYIFQCMYRYCTPLTSPLFLLITERCYCWFCSWRHFVGSPSFWFSFSASNSK